MDSDYSIRRPSGRHLNSPQVFGYSVGHVHNDLCSAMWFTYFLVFMESVLHFDARTAGLLLLIGQVADAIATPLVGIESDSIDLPFCKYGKRKTWHLFGTVASAFAFPMIFQRCYGGESADLGALAFYYSMLIIVFQIAWASIQINHLSLATELTPLSSERVMLTARRSGFQVASNILVYLITWLVLHINADSTKEKFSAADEPHFRLIVILLTIIGVSFSILFHILVHENSRHAVAHSSDENRPAGRTSSGNYDYSHASNHLRWYHWFKVGLFYRVALMYMCTRLVVNLTQVFMPMYLQYTLNLHKESCAYIPLTVYCSGYVGSILVEQINHRACKKNTYLFGALLSIASFVWIFFGGYDKFAYYHIYLVAIILGLSSQTILINSISFLNDLIGHNTSSSAFVFGAMSFTDKLSNGVAVMVIQFYRPEKMICEVCTLYYRDVLVFVCGGASVVSVIALLSFYFHDFNVIRRRLSTNPSTSDCSTSDLEQSNSLVKCDDESRPLLDPCK